MKMFLLLMASVAMAVAAPDARELRKLAYAAFNGHEFAAAAGLYEKAGIAAIAAGDSRNGFEDLYQALGTAGRAAENEHSIAIARRAISLADELLPRLSGHDREALHFNRIDCRGMLERAFSNLGRIAEGAAELRKIWSDIEQYRVAEEGGASGDPRRATDLARWSPKIRKLVWRTITREAEYLDIIGRSNEAVAILRRASEQLAALGRLTEEESFYAAKIRLSLSEILGFLGYWREAIEIRRAALADPAVRPAEHSIWIARINLLQTIQKYVGPSRANLDEAEECRRQLDRLSPTGRDTISAIVLEKMRARYNSDYDASGNLRRLAGELHAGGMLFDAMYADRDAVVAEANRPGLDGEFVRLLGEARKRGIKRSEPTLYREYATYLRHTGRPAEALPLFREALRLTESFGWRLHAPILRILIIGTLCDLHDFAAAEEEWKAVDRQIASIADFPPERALEVRVARTEWYIVRGEKEKAAAALADARAFADAQKLNAWQRRDLDSIKLDDAPAAVAAVPVPTTVPAAIDLQPLQVATSASPGDPLRARFTLRNPGTRARSGEVRASGPAIQLGLGGVPRRITGTAAAGGAENELHFPIALAPGEELGVVFDMKGTPAEGAKSAVRIVWRDTSGDTKADWRVTTEHDPFTVSVLNANQLRRNAFHAISFTHQIVRRASGPGLENIRLIASTPLRLEYYDAATHKLIAVDAEGNGTFTDPGDVLVSDADSNMAPDVEFDGKERLREIEIVVFPAAAGPADGAQNITVELLVGERWETVARNELE